MILYVPMDIVRVADKEYRIKGKKGSVISKLGMSVEIQSAGNKTPFVIVEPGEYEVEGISVFAYRVEESLGTLIQVEDVKIFCVAGVMSDSLIDDLDTIDVVMLDVDKIEKKAGAAMLGKIEPSYVIPCGEEGMMAQFVKEFEHTARQTDKLSLSKATMSGDVTDVVILTD